MAAIDLLVSEAAELLLQYPAAPTDARIAKVFHVLGVDRPPILDDEAFFVLVGVALSPVQAIQYEPSDPRPRWKYIRDYLSGFGDLPSAELEALSRHIAEILDFFARPRGRVSSELDALLHRQSGRCAICRLPFYSAPQAVRRRDMLRPLWRAPAELTRPEIDHIRPIMWTGDNALENLQVLCRACNAAKSDGVRIPIRQEVAYSATPIDQVPRIYLFRLLVWLAVDRDGQCETGGCRKGELTMRLVRPDAALIRGNLRLVCYNCDGASDRS